MFSVDSQLVRIPQLGPYPSHSQRNWAVLIRLRCEQTIVAQPRVTPAGGVPRRGSQVQKKTRKKHNITCITQDLCVTPDSEACQNSSTKYIEDISSQFVFAKEPEDVSTTEGTLTVWLLVVGFYKTWVLVVRLHKTCGV